MSEMKTLGGYEVVDQKARDAYQFLRNITKTMTGATADTNGASGLVPLPAAGDEGKVLFGSGTWGDLPEAGGSSGAAKPWRQIRNLTVPSDVSADTSGATWSTSADGVVGVEFNTDGNGEAFEVSELVFYIAGNWVSTGNLIIRANDNKTLIFLRDHLGTDTQYGCYWLRKLGKAWCAESTVGKESRYNYANFPVSRTGYRGQPAYPYETIATIKVQCSVAFDNAGAVIEVWGR